PDLFGLETVGQIRLKASNLCLPRRLTAAHRVDVPAHGHRPHDRTEQLLEVLVNVAGDHDLQVLPVIDQADVLALAGRFGELVVSVPVHSAKDGTLIAVLDGNE